jgi:tagatose-6-phosphate ketose/aldose isomerase
MSPLGRLVGLADQEKVRRGIVHTPREIAQQPAVWRKILGDLERDREPMRKKLAGMGVGGASTPPVVLIGAGTSDHVGRAVAPLLAKKWICDARAIPSTDLLTHHDELLPADRAGIAISFSRSGQSPESVAVLQLLLRKYPRFRNVIVTCNQEGAMAREHGKRDDVLSIVLDDAVNDRGLAMTSSFTAMVLAAQFMASIDDDGFRPIVLAASSAAERFLDEASKVAKELARVPFRRVCFLGSGALAAVARESALKVLELTAGRIATMSETFLGVRHGPLSAIDQSTLVVGFLSSDPLRSKYEIDLLQEIRKKKLGRETVVVAPADDPGKSPKGDDARTKAVCNRLLTLGVLELPDEYRPLYDIIFGQLLGLFFSLKLGFLPDTPSPSGAINRVVAGVKIH